MCSKQAPELNVKGVNSNLTLPLPSVVERLGFKHASICITLKRVVLLLSEDLIQIALIL